MNTKPRSISHDEWLEIRDLEFIRQSWALQGDETPSELAETIYGVKFSFQTDGPGYCGDLFLLNGSGSPDEPAVQLYRTEGGQLTDVNE